MTLAHGIGSNEDLPLPLDLVLQGSAIALLISFLGLGLLWPRPRFGDDVGGRPIPRSVERIVDSGRVRTLAQAVALVFVVFVGIVAALGPDDTRNPAPGVVYVLFWVGLLPAALLLGPVWAVVNPLRLAHRALARLPGLPGPNGMRGYPRRLGYWPAAIGLFAFAWLELAAPHRTSPRTVTVFFTGYAVAQLAGALLYGTGWFARADGFEVYARLLGRLAPIGRRADGRIVFRNPFRGLAATAIHPGLVAVLAVCLGSTAFDSVSGTSAWARLSESPPLPGALVATGGLLALVGLVGGSYLVAIRLAGDPVRTGAGSAARRRTAAGPGTVAGEIAHSLIPIVAGYLIAHYYSLLVLAGPPTFVLLAGVFGGAGTAASVSGGPLVEPGLVAAVQMVAVLTGHLVAVVAAHDRALRLFPGPRQLTGQAPLLLLMVGYTAGGLALLLAG